MKIETPIQELLEWVRTTLPMDLDTPRMIEEKIQSLLEKEKEYHIHKLFTGFEEWHKKEYGSQNVEIDQFNEYLETLNSKEK